MNEIQVKGSRAEIEPHQSIPHISTVNFARALRWHDRGVDSWTESDWYAALAGEAGECFQAVLKMGDTIKKRNRVRDGLGGNKVLESDLKQQLADEIGDVFIYLDLLARRAGFDLENCIRHKFNEVSVRMGFPERL